MHEIVQRLILIDNQIKEESDKLEKSKKVKIVAISKTFSIDSIMPLIDHGHIDFGENKIQEAKAKWADIKKNKPHLNLHFVGKLQTNKASDLVKLFDYFHSLESIKQAEILSKLEKKLEKKLKYFVQINIGSEEQKSGINPNEANDFINLCINEYNLNVIGLMCLPPNDKLSKKYFTIMHDLKLSLFNSTSSKLVELSMGMSNDYIEAISSGSTYLRLGTKIFGERK